MSIQGESSNIPQTPIEQVRVALIVPEKRSILVSPDFGSGLFVGARGERQSIEKAAHVILRRHIGLTAFSSAYMLGSYQNEDGEEPQAYGYALRPSHRGNFNPRTFNFELMAYQDFAAITEDPIDKHFAESLH